MTMNEAQIRSLLERYGQAMSVGDLAGILSCWELPALVLSDEAATLITNTGELERLFTRVIATYRSQGLLATRAQIERTEALADRLAAVDVRWPALDEAGVERSSERTHYILRLGEDGQPYIRVGIPRTG